jgi:hypothetical protein
VVNGAGILPDSFEPPSKLTALETFKKAVGNMPTAAGKMPALPIYKMPSLGSTCFPATNFCAEL